MFKAFAKECCHNEDGWCSLMKADCLEPDCQRDHDFTLFKKLEAKDRACDEKLHRELDEAAMKE